MIVRAIVYMLLSAPLTTQYRATGSYDFLDDVHLIPSIYRPAHDLPE